MEGSNILPLLLGSVKFVFLRSCLWEKYFRRFIIYKCYGPDQIICNTSKYMLYYTGDDKEDICLYFPGEDLSLPLMVEIMLQMIIEMVHREVLGSEETAELDKPRDYSRFLSPMEELMKQRTIRFPGDRG
jgi:hypothetical protein